MPEVKCLICDHEWKVSSKSYGHPRWCPKCKNPNWDSYRRKEHFCHNGTVKLTISSTIIQGLIRRKVTPSESHAHTVERMLINDTINETLFYEKKPRSDSKKKTRSIKITIDAHSKLKTMKKQYGIKTFDELLYKLIYNKTNQALCMK
jgi:hypothetical protein